MDNDAQLFTLDLLLALVPLTLVIGMSANAITGLATQVQSYAFGYSGQRLAIDIADHLVKTPGQPTSWSNETLQEIGLATYIGEGGCAGFASSTSLNNILDNSKLSVLENSFNDEPIVTALENLAGGTNIRIQVTNTSATILDIMGYYNASGNWQVTTNVTTIDTKVSSASDIFTAERVVGILEQVTLGSSYSFTPDLEAEPEIDSTPAVGDIDNDNVREIVFGASNYVYALNPNGTVKWQFDSGTTFGTSPPAIADLTGDGDLEIIIGDKEGNIFAIFSDGTQYWNYSTGVVSYVHGPAVGDVDGDETLEIAFALEENGTLVLLESDGTLSWARIPLPNGKIYSSPALGDVDGITSTLEIAVGSASDSVGALFILKDDGTIDGDELWNYTLLVNEKIRTTPAIFDINDDGNAEIVFGADDMKLYVLEKNGNLKWTRTFVEKISSSPVLADLDEDDREEIIFGLEAGYASDKGVFAYNDDGSLAWQYPAGPVKFSSPAVGDIDGDCRLEVVIGTDDKKIFAINHDGTLQWIYQTNESIQSSPVIVDVDGDNYLDIVVNDDENIYVLATLGVGVEWPTFHQCLKRAGFYYDADCSGPIPSRVEGETPATKAITGRMKVYIWR